MNKKTKYAIIGSGSMGREHIRNIDIIEDAEVVALSDPHNNSLKQSLELLNKNIPTFTNHIELMNSNLADAYIVSSPNFTHINILQDIIVSKKHLLIEKPLCTTTDDCKKFKELTKNYPAVIWTAMEYRYMPPVKKMIKAIHNNKIGDLKMLSIREHRFPFLKKINDWNRFSINSGGTLVNLQGELVGLNTILLSRAEGIGFAISSYLVKRYSDDLMKFGEVIIPWLGMELGTLTQEQAKTYCNWGYKPVNTKQ